MHNGWRQVWTEDAVNSQGGGHLAQAVVVGHLGVGGQRVPRSPEVGHRRGRDVVGRPDLQILQLVLVLVPLLLRLAWVVNEGM